MAKPIPIQLSKRDPQEELRSRLEKAPDQHAEALLASLDVLQSLHDQGVLELLRGVLGGGNKILEILVDAGKSPEAIRGIRNLVIMTKIVGSMDPESLKKLAKAVPDVLEGAAKAQESPPPGLWETLRMLRNKNLRRGVAVANNVLEALGRNSSTQKS
ncbi:MAG TPA: DUF1641 domain-containing protein [Candidatus Angelobacter sp.]